MSETQTPATDPDAPTRVTEILEAACRVIARDGAHGLHMKAVAREAGVSKALVHYYVQTRQELLRLALDFAAARTRSRLESEVDALGTGRERLERMLVAYAGNEALFAESHALSSATWGSLMLDEELAPAVRAGYQSWADWVAEAVAQGRSDGSLTRAGEARSTAIRLTALAEGLSSLVDTQVVTAPEAVRLVRAAVAELAQG